MISDPSYDAFELGSSDLPYNFRDKRKTICQAIRAIGAGTVTVTTPGSGADHPRVWTVADGEVVPCEITSVEEVGGSCTGVRAHIPRLHSNPGLADKRPGPA